MPDELNTTVDFLIKKGITNPEAGIILGTGLGKMINEIEINQVIPYDEIPNFPVATVEFHHGRLIYGKLEGRKVLAMQGRFHYYEGYSLQQITFPVRVMKRLGIKYLLLSNAAGALNLNFRKGSLMLIEDHINFLPDNPLRGKNDDQLGPRFPDMSRPYSGFLNDKLISIAKAQNIALHKGVYIAVMGPNLETRAEYRMFRSFGDAVGMSTVPEVIVANHMNLPCAAVSVLTDECDPDNLEPVDINEIIKTAAIAETGLIVLFKNLIREIEL
ncbi:MAG: purine-nucleoside phosphorylase [Bacteroidales bacterium]|nr:purine-nucleoside phosphorylase [Bacteroidales bacterium]